MRVSTKLSHLHSSAAIQIYIILNFDKMYKQIRQRQNHMILSFEKNLIKINV